MPPHPQPSFQLATLTLLLACSHQWSAWEVIFMHLYATRRLPYIADSEAFATPANALRVLLWTAAIPLVRGVHFCECSSCPFSTAQKAPGEQN